MIKLLITRMLLTIIILIVETTAMANNYKVEKIVSGLQFTEGPVWSPRNTLFFTDIPANRIYELTRDGQLKIYREPSGNANGLTFDKQGRLIACEHSNRRVTRTEEDGTVTVLADRYQGKRLNSPNDVVVKSDGSIYFTDPTYGIKKEEQELDFQGVYRIRADGQLELLVRDFKMPNGLCFSPDEKRLYIADSSELAHIRVFDVNPDGSLGNGRIFAKTTGPGGPDGMKVDINGNLYVAGPGGVWIFNPEGKNTDIISTPEVPANLAWGDEDGKTLYITARTSVYKVRLAVGGKLCR